MKKQTAAVLMAFCVLLGVCAGFWLSRAKPPEPVTVVEYVVDNSAAIKRLRISETLVDKLEQEQKLIVMEAELSQDITIDDSFATWEIFKKMQTITVKATGRYTVDLGSITEEDIIFDEYGERVVLRLPRPVVDSVTVNEEQTEFHSVEKGLLRFGEIRLTTAEQNEIYRQAKEAMEPELQLNQMPAAEDCAKASVSELAAKFLSAAGIDGGEIVVVWK